MTKILIVDDQLDNLYVLERLLKRDGYEVVQAEHGQTALDLAVSAQPDLILLDVMMPGMDGFEVLRRLRERPATQSIPVILLTANAPDMRQKIQGLNLGADEYLTQPINNRELLARIRALLRTKQVQDDLMHANTRLRALLEVIQAGNSTLQPSEVGQRLIDATVRAAHVDAGGIWLTGEQVLTRLAETGYDSSRCDRRRTIERDPTTPLGRALAMCEVEAGFVDSLYGADHPYGADFESAIIVPLVHRGTTVGVIQLATHEQHAFSAAEIDFVRAIADAAAIAVQNARLFEETDRQRQQLQALDNEKDEFISIVAHELKNPLASIKGYAGLLSRRARNDDALLPATKGLDVIEQQVNRMTMLLDQLRDVSHIGINRFSIEANPVDMVPLVERTAASLRTTTTDHALTVEVKDAPLWALIDEFRIEQVLSNLIGNAIKYSPDGGDVEIVVGRVTNLPGHNGKPMRPGEWLTVTVRDHGMGIPRTGRERLFERFFRAPNAKGRVSGMGLGLFISREIIVRHHGVMWVESEEGEGSLFGIALPLVEPQEVDRQVDQSDYTSISAPTVDDADVLVDVVEDE